jgi:hypothetical protein
MEILNLRHKISKNFSAFSRVLNFQFSDLLLCMSYLCRHQTPSRKVPVDRYDTTDYSSTMHFHIVDFHIGFHPKMSEVDIDMYCSNMSSIDSQDTLNKVD